MGDVMRNDFLFFVVLGSGNFLVLALANMWLEWREQRRVHIARIGPPNYRRWRRKVWKKRVTFGSLREWLRWRRRSSRNARYLSLKGKRR